MHLVPGMSSCFVNYCSGGNLFLLQLHSLPLLLPASFIDHLETLTANWACILLSLNSFKWPSSSATSFQGFWLVRSLNKSLWLVRALFIFTADLGCIVKWTFISGGWETNLVSWSLSSICNIFCNKRPCVLSSACQVATPQRRAVMFTRDVLRFYSPNISRRTQHTNVLLNGRGRWWCVLYTVHCTVATVHSYFAYKPRLWRISPQLLSVRFGWSQHSSHWIWELKVADCCLYFAYQAQPSPSQQWCSLQIFVSTYPYMFTLNVNQNCSTLYFWHKIHIFWWHA